MPCPGYSPAPVSRNLRVMDFLRIAAVLTCFYLPTTLPAQPIDTVLQLEEVLLSGASFVKNYSLNDSLQTLQPQLSPTQSLQPLGLLLAQEATLFVKQYSPGGLATLSLQGGSASQTSIYWEGFDLRSPTLGQLDLNLLPNWFFDRIEISQAHTQREGQNFNASGGLHLYQDISQKEIHQLTLNGLAGSFDQFAAGLNWLYQKVQQQHNLRVYHQQGQYDFPYLHPTGNRERLPNAQTQTTALQTRHRFWLSNRMFLKVNAWLQQANRQIPPTLQQAQSVASQQDQSIRAVGTWSYSQDSGGQLNLHAAYFGEQFQYQDSLAGLQSNGQTHSSRLRGEYTHESQRIDHLSWGLHSTLRQDRATATAFDGLVRDTRLRNRFTLKGQIRPLHLHFKAQMALQWQDWQWQPLSGSATLGYYRTDAWQLYLSAARTLRLPTLNDRFWADQGNPNLEPELGWNLQFHHSLKKFIRITNIEGLVLSHQIDVFHRRVDNWIIWLPEQGVWRPQNVRQVWSRGINTELELRFRLSYGGPSLLLRSAYAWTKATNELSTNPNSQSLDKQLIYTPEHRLIHTVALEFSNWSLEIHPNYTSRVFTLSDNSEALPAFWLLGASVQYQLNKTWTFQADLHNLLGQPYQTIANRPMPLFNWQLGIRFQLPFSKSN